MFAPWSFRCRCRGPVRLGLGLAWPRNTLTALTSMIISWRHFDSSDTTFLRLCICLPSAAVLYRYYLGGRRETVIELQSYNPSPRELKKSARTKVGIIFKRKDLKYCKGYITCISHTKEHRPGNQEKGFRSHFGLGGLFDPSSRYRGVSNILCVIGIYLLH